MSGNSVERLLDKIEAGISTSLIFAGILDSNAKLLSFRRGKASFSLPIERHDTLDVQLSLMFSLIRQLEDISGPHKFTVTRFAKHNTFLFGTSDLHIFVITSSSSDWQIAKTLADLVSNPNDTELPVATPTFVGRKEQTMATAMASVRHEESVAESQKFSGSKSRPEAIAILQGYLMAVDQGITIQEDASGYYKIKATEGDRLNWSMIEKVSSTFKDKIEIHHFGKDNDGKLFIRISIK